MAYTVLLLLSLCCRAAFAIDVLAHFMVSNTYSYSQTEWAADIQVAQGIGIDGFALNWAPPDCSPSPNDQDWNLARIADAFTVAAQNDFKLIYSFDMSYTTSDCTTAWNTTFMAAMITDYASTDVFYRWKGDIVVSTYAGEGYGDNFFEELKSLLESENTPVVLVPALTTFSSSAQTEDPSTVASNMLSDYPSIDGYLNWQAWPADVDANLTDAADTAFKGSLSSAGRSGPYIMGVSPWQFKDLDNGIDNSWVEYSDTLFQYRWIEALNVQPDLVEIITWNDWAESHYIRDLPPLTGPASAQLGDQGNYVYGHDHSAWRFMAQFYISVLKGSEPAPSEDSVVFWYRTHPKDATCTDGYDKVRNSDYPADAVFAWALVTEPSNVTVTVGSNTATFYVDVGCPTVNMVAFPDDADLGSGIYPTISIVKNGQAEVSVTGSCSITADCVWEDFNPCVGLVTA